MKYSNLLLLSLILISHFYPKTGTDSFYDSTKNEHVDGYTRNDGTHVDGYDRHEKGTARDFMSALDQEKYDNSNNSIFDR